MLQLQVYDSVGQAASTTSQLGERVLTALRVLCEDEEEFVAGYCTEALRRLEL